MAITVGWEEWVGLPDLGIPAIRAKVDTGAQTSALHAFAIHRVTIRGRERVRFGVHPLPEQPDVELYCEADLVAEREVTSSNGETELRFIVATRLTVGGHSWPIEVSLTNRERMAYRMLLGRRALEETAVVDVTRACVHGNPDLSVYDGLRHAEHARRPLSVGVLTGAPENAAAERLAEAGAARGHAMHILGLDRCAAVITGEGTQLLFDDAPMPPLDAVLALIAPRDKAFAMPILRQMEASGLRCMPASSALAAAGDPPQALQSLARGGLAVPATGLVRSPDMAEALIGRLGGAPLEMSRFAGATLRAPTRLDTRQAVQAVLRAEARSTSAMMLQKPAEPGTRRRCLVIGRRLAAALRVREDTDGYTPRRRPRRIRIDSEERRLAKRAARALRLEAAIVDLASGQAGPMVLAVTPLRDFRVFEDAAGIDAAGLLLAHLERRVRR